MYEIAPQELEFATNNGISPDELQYMLSHSSLHRAPRFNRRYHGWLFYLDGYKLVRMAAHKSATTVLQSIAGKNSFT